MRALASALLAAMALASCAPSPESLGLDETALQNGIGRRIGSPGACVVIASEGRIAYTWGSYLTCGRELPTCDGKIATAERLAQDGAIKRISCPYGAGVASWWAASGRTSTGVVTVVASMAGPDALPAIEVERRLTPILKEAGLTVGPELPPATPEGAPAS